jgi:MFS family permease
MAERTPVRMHRVLDANTAPPTRSRGLVRYVVAATLARGADGGAAVGLVLLATATPHLSRASMIGGLLATCLTAPHLLGPVVARFLDRAHDGRRLLAGAFALYGVTLTAGSVALGKVPVLLVGGLVAVAGLCGPLLTGGLSSQLASLARSDEPAQRRAQGWDGVTYGIGGSAGPAAVAALAAIAGPLASMAMLSIAALVASALALTLPRAEGAVVPRSEVFPVRRTLRMIALSGPLRRVTYVTMLAAMPSGAVAVLAVALSRHLGTGIASGAALAAAYGLGNLLGSLLLTALPLKGEAERLVTRYAAAIGVAFALCAIVPTYPLALLSFGLAGAANAPFFTATLASRSTYAPPEARAQVFVSTAALKVATASAGTALAGVLIGFGSRLLLCAGAVIVLAASATTIADRHLTETR